MVLLWDLPGATIGGTSAGTANVISGNGNGDGLGHGIGGYGDGISIGATCLIEGNLIGTDVTGEHRRR